VYGRVANKGMEGLAITPDGTTLVGIMQNALIQDANEGKKQSKLLRIVTFDIASGVATHQYGYLLTAGSGVSEILALNNHEFLVDERDGNGRANGNDAVIKQLFKIDLNTATDISNMDASAVLANNAGRKNSCLSRPVQGNSKAIDGRIRFGSWRRRHKPGDIEPGRRRQTPHVTLGMPPPALGTEFELG